MGLSQSVALKPDLPQLHHDQAQEALSILAYMVEPEASACSFDHHGYCQEHGWFGEPGECGTARARELLGFADV